MKMKFKVPKLIISFEKSLKIRRAQSVLEYSLLLVVIATIMLTFFVNDFQPIKSIFEDTTNSLIERIVNGTTN